MIENVIVIRPIDRQVVADALAELLADEKIISDEYKLLMLSAFKPEKHLPDFFYE